MYSHFDHHKDSNQSEGHEAADLIDVPKENEGTVSCLISLVNMNADVEENAQKEEEKSSSNKCFFLAHTTVMEEGIIPDKIEYIYYRISHSYYSFCLMHIPKKSFGILLSIEFSSLIAFIL